MSSPPDRRWRLARAFAGFWRDFLVGDAPEIFAGTLGIVGLTLLVAHTLPSVAVMVALPITVACLLGASVLRRRS